MQGNALGKGPVLFCFGAKGLRRLAAAAAAGHPEFQQLELDMHRLAGVMPHSQLHKDDLWICSLHVAQGLLHVVHW